MNLARLIRDQCTKIKLFLDTSSELKIFLFKKIPFAVISKNEYLDVNFKNYVEDLFTGNYKILLRKIKENLNKERKEDIPYQWIERQ